MTPSRSARTGKHRAADVCTELGIQPYVLKFWEAEIPELGERVGEDRLYGRDELAMAKRIREMVEEQRMGLGEVRSRLSKKAAGRPKAPAKRASETPRARVEHLEEELRSLRTIRADHERLQREVEKLRRELVEADGLAARAAATPAAPEGLRGEVDACLKEARRLTAELDELLDDLRS